MKWCFKERNNTMAEQKLDHESNPDEQPEKFNQSIIDLNSCTLTGNIIDITFRKFISKKDNEEKDYVRFKLVVHLPYERHFKGEEGKKYANLMFLRCMAFGKVAKAIKSYGKKGRRVAIVGAIVQQRIWHEELKEFTFVNEIQANDIIFYDYNKYDYAQKKARKHTSFDKDEVEESAEEVVEGNILDDENMPF